MIPRLHRPHGVLGQSLYRLVRPTISPTRFPTISPTNSSTNSPIISPLSPISHVRSIVIPKKSIPPSMSKKTATKNPLELGFIDPKLDDNAVINEVLYKQKSPPNAVADSLVPDLSKILKPITPNDSFVSCSIFDIHGNVTAVSRKFPKTQFLSENGLYPRDLRKIDSSAVDIIPTIAVRTNCILVNLLHIKAIVKSDLVMIFDTLAPQNAQKLSLFMYDLESKLKATTHLGSYEFRALESILINVMTCLETELHIHLQSCGSILQELEDQINRDRLRELLIKSKLLTSFYQKLLLIRNVLDELLENDEDLEQMYLTERKLQPDYSRQDFTEVEMILESYYKQCDEIVQQLESLINDIRSTEEIVNIILDANRNSLMLFELKITVYTLGFTVATAIPAFYGMNLKNYIEDSYLGFGGVVMVSLMMAGVVTVFNSQKLKSVQKLTMMIPGAETRLGMMSGESGAASAATGAAPAALKEDLLKKLLTDRFSHVYSGMQNTLQTSRRRGWLRNRLFLRRKRTIADSRHRDMIWKWLIDGKK